MSEIGEFFSEIADICRENTVTCLIIFLVFLIPLGFAAYEEFVVVPKLATEVSQGQQRTQNLQAALQKAERERDQGRAQLKVFQEAAEGTFPNTPPEGRLALLGKFTAAIARLQAADEKSKPDRILGPDLNNTLLLGLKGIQPLDIELTCPLGDAETFAFASQIKGMFETAGWRVNDVNMAPLAVSQHLQLVVGKSPPPELQKALAPLFGSDGAAPRISVDDKIGEGNLRIIIGTK